MILKMLLLNLNERRPLTTTEVLVTHTGFEFTIFIYATWIEFDGLDKKWLVKLPVYICTFQINKQY